MALGTDYKRNKDREDARREENLDNHFALMTEFIKQGLDRELASQEAYAIIVSNRHMGDCKIRPWG